MDIGHFLPQVNCFSDFDTFDLSTDFFPNAVCRCFFTCQNKFDEIYSRWTEERPLEATQDLCMYIRPIENDGLQTERNSIFIVVDLLNLFFFFLKITPTHVQNELVLMNYYLSF
jgi:hypothetical protein